MLVLLTAVGGADLAAPAPTTEDVRSGQGSGTRAEAVVTPPSTCCVQCGLRRNQVGEEAAQPAAQSALRWCEGACRRGFASPPATNGVQTTEDGESFHVNGGLRMRSVWRSLFAAHWHPPLSLPLVLALQLPYALASPWFVLQEHAHNTIILAVDSGPALMKTGVGSGSHAGGTPWARRRIRCPSSRKRPWPARSRRLCLQRLLLRA